jgi:hypothetical protein
MFRKMAKMAATRVVHCKQEPYDVYIGRPSKWGNPFSHKAGPAQFRVATREDAILRYEAHLRSRPDLMGALHELRGKALGCWCKPLSCHGDVLAKLADALVPAVIESFRNAYFFLSNFYVCSVRVIVPGVGLEFYPSAEHAFQALKSLDPGTRQRIAVAATPGLAKAMGRKTLLRPDWEAVKDDVMRVVLSEKFRDAELLRLLKATGDAYLVEGNTRHDTYWGVCSCGKCNGRGINRLGQLLMQLRSDRRE